MASDSTAGDASLTYSGAGVDVEAGRRTAASITASIATTHDDAVLSNPGGFSALYALQGYRKPVLVSGADGVGTKLELARLSGSLDTIGIDCVAMCVNDVLCHGARPLFFLDYIAVDSLRPGEVERIVAGVAEGCRRARCSLVGGETAEMPGVYRDGRFDLAGFCVAVAEEEALVRPERVGPGMAVIGLASSGLHSNGYSLVRRAFGAEETVAHLPAAQIGELLEPTRIYADAVAALLPAVTVYGIAHVTGGGWFENLPRMVPDGCALEVRRDALPVPDVFHRLRQRGIADDEMYGTFNMGLGMAVVVDAASVSPALDALTAAGERCAHIGTVVPGARGVRFV